MFKWITNLVNDARIGIAYLDYERECKQQWISEADSDYSTAHIAHNIKTLLAASTLHVEQAFDAPMRHLQSRRDDTARAVADAREKMDVLVRDYKGELDAAYDILNAGREELDRCRTNLAGAHDELHKAKDALDAWYARAQGNWLGNGGKKLPQHAFFGQDLSDRDRHKNRRDTAARAVSKYKSERSSIERRLDAERARIQQIKDDRQRMFDLKKTGFDKRLIASVIQSGEADLRMIDESLPRTKESREKYIHETKVSLGIYQLEEEIVHLECARELHIKAFDSDSLRLERKARHRAAWMARHGK